MTQWGYSLRPRNQPDYVLLNSKNNYSFKSTILWRTLEQPQGRSTSPSDIRPRRGVYWAPKAENSGQRGEQGPGENGSTGGHALGVAGASSSQRSTRPTLRPDSLTSWRCGTFSRGQSANGHYSGLEVQKIPYYSRKQICSYPGCFISWWGQWRKGQPSHF